MWFQGRESREDPNYYVSVLTACAACAHSPVGLICFVSARSSSSTTTIQPATITSWQVYLGRLKFVANDLDRCPIEFVFELVDYASVKDSVDFQKLLSLARS